MHSKTPDFTLDGVKFYSYQASDSHGSHCKIFTVNKVSVSSRVYFHALLQVLQRTGCWEHVMYLVSVIGTYNWTAEDIALSTEVLGSQVYTKTEAIKVYTKVLGVLEDLLEKICRLKGCKSPGHRRVPYFETVTQVAEELVKLDQEITNAQTKLIELERAEVSQSISLIARKHQIERTS